MKNKQFLIKKIQTFIELLKNCFEKYNLFIFFNNIKFN